MIPRYTTKEMAAVWNDTTRFKKWLAIEVALLEVLEKRGLVKPKDLAAFKKSAKIDIADIRALEESTQHEIVAFLKSISRGSERTTAAQYLHYGLTSSDIMDTALSLQVRDACSVLARSIDSVNGALRRLALEYKDVPTIGRSHGVHAEPTSFGLKFARFYAEGQRALARLEAARAECSTGKLSGAVGNFAHLPPEYEEQVCGRLGLTPEPVSTQVIPRDRYAYLVSTLALIGTFPEDIATEIRHLQRTEVLEMMEPFYEKQAGSSAMPHKKNPVLCERICGLARLLRGYADAELQSVVLWHERDISHSSVDRVAIPDAFLALDYMLVKTLEILKGLTVDFKRVGKNLGATGGLIYSQRVLLALIDKGMDRLVAYDVVQGLALKAWNSEESFEAMVKADARVKKHLSAKEIAGCFDPAYYLREVDSIYKRGGLT
ncbi:MAG: adenylosuccinate lyase [bacterium]